MKNPNVGVTGPCEALVSETVDLLTHINNCGQPGRWFAYGVMPFGSLLCPVHEPKEKEE